VIRNSDKQWTDWRDLIRDGGVAPTNGAALAPVFPDAVIPVPPGIEGRFRALANLIKASPSYNTAIGKALGITRDAANAPDLSTVSPVLGAWMIGNGVFVDWKWNGHAAHLDQCEIHVDRADGKGFTLLTFDTTPGYLDTHPLPSPATRWSYRAIYRVGDRQVGVWSAPVSLLVG
jgi:hypothetical protein